MIKTPTRLDGSPFFFFFFFWLFRKIIKMKMRYCVWLLEIIKKKNVNENNFLCLVFNENL